MIWTHTLAAIIGAVLAASGTWKVGQWRLDAYKVEAMREKLAAEQTAYNVATQRMKEAQNAQRQAAARAEQARRDAAAARGAADGLRDDLATALRTNSYSLAACNDGAAIVADVLQRCTGAYRDLAQTADRLDNDRRTLMDAWPK